MTKIDWNEEPSTREKLYFGVIMLLIAVAMMRLLWLPQQMVIKNQKKDINNIELQITTVQKFIDIDKKISAPQKVEHREKLDKQIEEALKSVSEHPKSAIAQIIRRISSKRVMGNVSLNSISFKTANVKSGYAVVPVSLSVLGTFSSLQKYLRSIEKMKYLFTVDNITLSLSEKNSGLISANLEASIYIRSSGAPTPGGEGAK